MADALPPDSYDAAAVGVDVTMRDIDAFFGKASPARGHLFEQRSLPSIVKLSFVESHAQKRMSREESGAKRPVKPKKLVQAPRLSATATVWTRAGGAAKPGPRFWPNDI
jgi:hypothetical protein